MEINSIFALVPLFQYLGEWYTFATLPGYFQPEGISCQRPTYGLLPDGNVSSYIVQTLPSGEQDDVCGYATIPDPANPGKTVALPGQAMKRSTGNGEKLT